MPSATATTNAETAEPKGIWTRLTCKNRQTAGITYKGLPPTPAPDRTAEEAFQLFIAGAADNHPPFDQLADLTWERRNYLKRPERWERHTVFVGSKDGVERAAVHADRVQPGPTWVTDDFSLCVEPIPPQVNPTRTYEAPLSCRGDVTRVATDPPTEHWGVASDTFLRHALYEFLRWTRISDDFGWPQGLTYERRPGPHTKGRADMVGSKDGVEQAVVGLERMATHDAWVMTGYAFCAGMDHGEASVPAA